MSEVCSARLRPSSREKQVSRGHTLCWGLRAPPHPRQGRPGSCHCCHPLPPPAVKLIHYSCRLVSPSIDVPVHATNQLGQQENGTDVWQIKGMAGPWSHLKRAGRTGHIERARHACTALPCAGRVQHGRINRLTAAAGHDASQLPHAAAAAARQARRACWRASQPAGSCLRTLGVRCRSPHALVAGVPLPSGYKGIHAAEPTKRLCCWQPVTWVTALPTDQHLLAA